jgi:hypothetical protein
MMISEWVKRHGHRTHLREGLDRHCRVALALEKADHPEAFGDVVDHMKVLVEILRLREDDERGETRGETRPARAWLRDLIAKSGSLSHLRRLIIQRHSASSLSM